MTLLSIVKEPVCTPSQKLTPGHQINNRHPNNSIQSKEITNKSKETIRLKESKADKWPGVLKENHRTSNIIRREIGEGKKLRLHRTGVYRARRP